MLVQVMQIRAGFIVVWEQHLQPIEPRSHDWAGFEATLIFHKLSNPFRSTLKYPPPCFGYFVHSICWSSAEPILHSCLGTWHHFRQFDNAPYSSRRKEKKASVAIGQSADAQTRSKSANVIASTFLLSHFAHPFSQLFNTLDSLSCRMTAPSA